MSDNNNNRHPDVIQSHQNVQKIKETLFTDSNTGKIRPLKSRLWEISRVKELLIELINFEWVKWPIRKLSITPTREDVVNHLNEHYAKLEIYTAVNSTPRLNAKDDGYDIAYRLAATDLFVEKAAEYLRLRARLYFWLGMIAYLIGASLIGVGLFTAISKNDPSFMKEKSNEEKDERFFEKGSVYALIDMVEKEISPTKQPENSVPPQNVGSDQAEAKVKAAAAEVIERNYKWAYSWSIADRFLKSFTFYGFIVLAAVAAWRFGKSMLDQSERLYEKRHTMRQGRLYVHLKDGNLSAEELVTAFAWNDTRPNAFGELKTDTKAPVGATLESMRGILASKEGKS